MLTGRLTLPLAKIQVSRKTLDRLYIRNDPECMFLNVVVAMTYRLGSSNSDGVKSITFQYKTRH